MAIIIELSSNFGEYLSTVTALPSVLFPNRATVPVIVIKQRPLFRAWKHAAKNWRSPQKMPVTYDASAAATTQWRCCRYAAAAPVSKPAGRLFLLLSISGPCHRGCRAKLLSKVIYPMYTKHWRLAQSKFGLKNTRWKCLPEVSWAAVEKKMKKRIWRVLIVDLCLFFLLIASFMILALPKTARSAQTNKSISFIWIA